MLAVEWPLVRATLGDAEGEDEPSAAFAELYKVKAEVPAARERRGARQWAALVDPPLPRVSSPKASRAYHKLKEIVQSCALSRQVRLSVHLCEAPGGFVQCVGECFAAPGWRWVALTLPVAPDPALSLLPVDRGRFVRGDVHAHGEALCEDGTADLVTADGAVEMDHERIEQAHLSLLEAQTRVALRALAPGGCFVAKFFEGGTAATRAWIARLTTQFHAVSLIKPNTSRATNSERYLVARDYRGPCSSPGRYPSRAWSAEVSAVLDRMARDQTHALARILHQKPPQ